MELNNIHENNISLDEDSHVYSLNEKNIEFTSVTTYISDFFEKFNQIEVAKKLIKTSMKYAHRSIDDIIEDWNVSRDYGTFVHKQIENHFKGISDATDMKAKHGVQWLVNFTENRICDIHVEKIIFSEELKLAGTMDVLIYLKESDEYIIIDWKTNKKIDTRSFRNKMGTHHITSNIEDCKYNVYAFQLSLYRYLLETYYGLKIKQQIIAHIDDNGVNAYLPPYYKGHMEAISNLRKDTI
jgi:ATP-dependent exoDNAse (exonuclease V) beta subunit